MDQSRTSVSIRAQLRRCRIFNCDRRHGNFCCEDCGYKHSRRCKNHCLNGPERCGQVSSTKEVTQK